MPVPLSYGHSEGWTKYFYSPITTKYSNKGSILENSSKNPKLTNAQAFYGTIITYCFELYARMGEGLNIFTNFSPQPILFSLSPHWLYGNIQLSEQVCDRSTESGFFVSE